MLTFLNVDEAADYKDGKQCSTCGSDFLEYKKDGKLGCPDCYNNLAEFMVPVLSGFHGEKRHIGKSPVHKDDTGFTGEVLKNNRTVIDTTADLQSQLNSAILEERYEEAAVLRDRIREINLSLKKN